MKKKGLAAVYDKPNTPFKIREYPLRDVKGDEVLVKVTMSTICRSDIHSYQGHRPNPCPIPKRSSGKPEDCYRVSE